MKPRMKGKPGTTLPRNQSSWLIYTEEAGRIQHKMAAEQSRKWPETEPLRWNAILHLMAATINSSASVNPCSCFMVNSRAFISPPERVG